MISKLSRYGLIGYPIAHSQSPRLFAEAYDGRFPYDLIETLSFEDAWKTFLEGPYRAINVTAPFKTLALQAVIDSHTSDSGLKGSGELSSGKLNSDALVPEYVREIGACNIVVKTESGLAAYNSDYLGVKELISRELSIRTTGSVAAVSEIPAFVQGTAPVIRTAAVIGFGGAGRAAYKAAVDCGLETRVYRHNQLACEAVYADLVIYTLPKAVEGIDQIRCKVLIEANYKNPCLVNMAEFGDANTKYISGLFWLEAQACLGYQLMTGASQESTDLTHSPAGR